MVKFFFFSKTGHAIFSGSEVAPKKLDCYITQGGKGLPIGLIHNNEGNEELRILPQISIYFFTVYIHVQFQGTILH